MPISAISSASGIVIAEKTIANLSETKKMEQTAATPKVAETKRISVADDASKERTPPAASAAAAPAKRAGDSEAPPAPKPPLGGNLDIKA